MVPGLYASIDLRYQSAAFLDTFDRFRSRLMQLKLSNKKMAQRLLSCPPAGANLEPQWPTKWFCRQLICPFCRYRTAYRLCKEAWAGVDEHVHVYWKSYEVRSVQEYTTGVRSVMAADRARLIRKMDKPFVRFQRFGVELEHGQNVYRAVQLVAVRRQTPDAHGFEHSFGPYGKVIEVACRYSAANLLAPPEVLHEILSLPLLRRVEYSRGT